MVNGALPASGRRKPGVHGEKIGSPVSVNGLAPPVDHAINVQIPARDRKDHVLFGRTVSNERQGVVVNGICSGRLSLAENW